MFQNLANLHAVSSRNLLKNVLIIVSYRTNQVNIMILIVITENIAGKELRETCSKKIVNMRMASELVDKW